LPLKEDSKLPYASTNGLHHACGHDAHTTILLMAAKIIVANKEKLRKKVTFCFQPGEEGKRGAFKLFNAYPTLLDNIDHCFALHTDSSI
jgi:metal-dependent amidase/aminoacylase/carboxypeptidase family protein